jgi:hypothetical protein
MMILRPPLRICRREEKTLNPRISWAGTCDTCLGIARNAIMIIFWLRRVLLPMVWRMITKSRRKLMKRRSLMC